jgi:hypothetical protein
VPRVQIGHDVTETPAEVARLVLGAGEDASGELLIEELYEISTKEVKSET